jgi:hypothetical protein
MKLDQDFVPATVDEAIKAIVESLDFDDLDYIKKNDPSSLHHFGGMGMRNSWSFWEKDTPIHFDFRKRFNLWGIADDISGIIFEGVWATVLGQNVEEVLQAKAEEYRAHWIKYDIDPETGEKL